MTMKLKKTLQIILALCLGLWMISCQQEHIKLTSPNGKLSLEFTLDEEGLRLPYRLLLPVTPLLPNLHC